MRSHEHGYYPVWACPLLSPFSSVLSKPIPVDSHPYHSTESVFVQITRSSLLQNLAVIGLDCGQHLIQLVTPSFSKYCSLLDSRTPFSLVPHPWLLLFISQAPPHCKAQSLDPSLHHLHYLLRWSHADSRLINDLHNDNSQVCISSSEHFPELFSTLSAFLTSHLGYLTDTSKSRLRMNFWFLLNLFPPQSSSQPFLALPLNSYSHILYQTCQQLSSFLLSKADQEQIKYF